MGDTLTAAELDAIRARCEAARRAEARDCGCESPWCDACRAITIAHDCARADIPALLRHVAALEAAMPEAFMLSDAANDIDAYVSKHPALACELRAAAARIRALHAPPATEAGAEPGA